MLDQSAQRLCKSTFFARRTDSNGFRQCTHSNVQCKRRSLRPPLSSHSQSVGAFASQPRRCASARRVQMRECAALFTSLALATDDVTSGCGSVGARAIDSHQRCKHVVCTEPPLHEQKRSMVPQESRQIMQTKAPSCESCSLIFDNVCSQNKRCAMQSARTQFGFLCAQ